MRSRFNQILGATLADVRQEARIVLDAADGAAITFIEDPDDALRCAARGHDAVVTTGTSALLLPEQVLGRAADARIDLFALGVILYEMMTGRSPSAAAICSP